jgi:hypothetical protein
VYYLADFLCFVMSEFAHFVIENGAAIVESHNNSRNTTRSVMTTDMDITGIESISWLVAFFLYFRCGLDGHGEVTVGRCWSLLARDAIIGVQHLLLLSEADAEPLAM